MPAWAATIKDSELSRRIVGRRDLDPAQRRLGVVDRFTLYVSNLLPHARSPARPLGQAKGDLCRSRNTVLPSVADQQGRDAAFRVTFVRCWRPAGLWLQVIDSIALAQAVVSEPTPPVNRVGPRSSPLNW